jgi:hypothetical protein
MMRDRMAQLQRQFARELFGGCRGRDALIRHLFMSDRHGTIYQEGKTTFDTILDRNFGNLMGT